MAIRRQMSVRFCKTFGKIQWVAGGKDALRGSTWGDDLEWGRVGIKGCFFLDKVVNMVLF